jgi:hypothetical protein
VNTAEADDIVQG